MNEKHLLPKTHSIAISVVCDKAVYPIGATVYIRTRLNDVISSKKIIIEVHDLNKQILISKEIDPTKYQNKQLKSAGIYQTFFIMNGSKWKIGSTYTIVAKHGEAESYDSFLVDRRHPIVQTDRSVYLLGSDIILTVIDPDANLNSQKIETVGNKPHQKITVSTSEGKISNYKLIETGKDTGIFQGIIRLTHGKHFAGKKKFHRAHGGGPFNGSIPAKMGEQIEFTYSNEYETVSLSAYASNFGASVQLDQRSYTWTDKVMIVVIAPDYNIDANVIDKIHVTIKTKDHSISPYTLIETGPNTGIFVGSVILTGNPKAKGKDGVDGTGKNPTGLLSGSGPTDGLLSCDENDEISVSFQHSEINVVKASAKIQWNVGEIKWLQSSYSQEQEGVLQIVDPDMNLDPLSIDQFHVRVWSDTDPRGIQILMKETGESTGIFQGMVRFGKESSGNVLHVHAGDVITGEYIDRTLPQPYTRSDKLRLTATTFIGTVVPQLERVSVLNPKLVDATGNELKSVMMSQDVYITAQLLNSHDLEQPYAFLVQIQDANFNTVWLNHIVGKLKGNESSEPKLLWTPILSGVYYVQIFVWQSINNPNALSPPSQLMITVNPK